MYVVHIFFYYTKKLVLCKELYLDHYIDGNVNILYMLQVIIQKRIALLLYYPILNNAHDYIKIPI